MPGYATPQNPGQAGFTPVPAGPSQGLSIASMVTGIVGVLLSLAFFGFLPGVAAVVMGHIAQKKQPQARAFWLTGLITGYVATAIGVITGVLLIGGFLLFATIFNSGSSNYYGGY